MEITITLNEDEVLTVSKAIEDNVEALSQTLINHLTELNPFQVQAVDEMLHVLAKARGKISNAYKEVTTYES